MRVRVLIAIGCLLVVQYVTHAQSATLWASAIQAGQLDSLFVLSEKTRHSQWFHTALHSPSLLQSISELQDALPDRMSAFISWTPLPDARLLIIVATSHRATFFVRPVPPWADELLEQFLLNLHNPPTPELLTEEFERYTRQAIELYDMLLRDAINWLPRATFKLVVSPFGKWNLLPLSALIAEHEFPVVSYRHLPFLAKRYRFLYVPSAAAWLECRARATQFESPQRRAIMVAPDYFGYQWPYVTDSTTRYYLASLPQGQGDLPPVAGTSQIAETIEHIGGSVWRGPQASSQYLQRQPLSVGVWHVQAHVLPLAPQPDSILLVLTPYEDEGLYALSALMQRPLKAHLAVWPACHWAMCSLEEAAQSFAIARMAFRQMQIGSNLINLWYGADLPMADLFTTFYRRLSSGLSPSEAWAQAQVHYLNQTQSNLAAHPYYWAGFVLSGADIPVPLRRSPLWWYIPLAILVMSWFVWRYLRKLKRAAEEEKGEFSW